MPNIKHSFLPTVGEQEAEMLATLGIKHIHELFNDIPNKFLLKRRLKIPHGLSEAEVRQNITNTLSKNWNPQKYVSFLGGGVWSHLVPEAVKAVVGRTEFLTAYTPYQAEISQGMLQALFEYQSLIAELVALPVVNASMYDWASALGEAALMVSRVTKRKKFLIPELVAPGRLAVLNTYTQPAGLTIQTIDFDPNRGSLDIEQLKTVVDDQTAGVYFENPAYLGYLETEVQAIRDLTHDVGAELVVGVDPVSLGVICPPGEYGADIVIGEGQPLGNELNFGGPLLGIFACQDDRRLLRQLPGRIIGLTTTESGDERGFVMTMQAREQHIRREKATSNICSNQSLCAVTAAVYLSLLGPEGLRRLGENILQLRQYAEQQLSQLNGIQVPRFTAPNFKEFVLSLNNNPETQGSTPAIRTVLKRMLTNHVLGGIPLDQSFPKLGESLLICVTEKHRQEDIDQLVQALSEALEEE